MKERRKVVTARRQQASQWFVEHEFDSDVRPARYRQWRLWSARAKNLAEYQEMVRIKGDLSALPRAHRATDEELRQDGFEVPGLLQGTRAVAVRVRRWCDACRGIHKSSSVAVFASIALLALFAGALVTWVNRADHTDEETGPPGAVYATAPGEQREFTLPDHSQVTLGGASAIVAQFTPSVRNVILQRGEAMFRVKHEAHRSFTVHAGIAETTAVGTVFHIRCYSTHVNVWVSEGAVEVAPVQKGVLESKDRPQWFPVKLERGQEIDYDVHGHASAPRPADLGAAASLAQGLLVYQSRPLSEVIEDVQRYSSRRLVLDSSATELTYSGTIGSQLVDQWLRGLPQIFPVDIIDCLQFENENSASTGDMASWCKADPERVYIRSRRRGDQNILRSITGDDSRSTTLL